MTPVTTNQPTNQAPELGFNAFGVRTEHTLDLPEGTFTTTLYPADVALDLLPWLLALAAGPSGVLIELLRSSLKAEDILEADVTGKTAREGLLMLSEQVVKHGGSAKLKEVLSTTLYHHGASGAPVSCSQQFGAVFQGRLMLLGRVIAWVLEVQFGPFSRGGTSATIHPLIQLLKKSVTTLGEQQSEATSNQANG